MTTARSVATPLSGSTVRSLVIVIVEPVGDVSGTESQPTAASTVRLSANAASGWSRIIEKRLSDFRPFTRELPAVVPIRATLGLDTINLIPVGISGTVQAGPVRAALHVVDAA